MVRQINITVDDHVHDQIVKKKEASGLTWTEWLKHADIHHEE